MGHHRAAGGGPVLQPCSDEAFRRSIGDPESFWGQAAAAIDWYRPTQRVLDRGRDPFTRWFFGGELNTRHNCLDRHVNAGRGDRVVLIYDSPVTSRCVPTYREMLDGVSRLAGALAGLGVGRGDRVVSCMPMLPQAVMAMLACDTTGGCADRAARAEHSLSLKEPRAGEVSVNVDTPRSLQRSVI